MLDTQVTRCEGPACQAVHRVEIGELTDDGPASWLRFEYLDASGAVVAGPTRLAAAGHACIAGATPIEPALVVPRVYQLRAVDLAGNASAAFRVEGTPCEELVIGTACDPEAAEAARMGAPRRAAAPAGSPPSPSPSPSPTWGRCGSGIRSRSSSVSARSTTAPARRCRA